MQILILSFKKSWATKPVLYRSMRAIKRLSIKWHFNHHVPISSSVLVSEQNLLRFQDENSLTVPGSDVTMTFQAFTTRHLQDWADSLRN